MNWLIILIGRVALKKILTFFVVLAAVLAGISTLWKVNYPSGTWRYKITVEVETPEGIKSGSAVREMRVSRGLQLNPDVGSANFGLIGEGVVIDLGQRGVLFSIISPSTWSNEFFETFYSQRGGGTAEGIKYYASLPLGTKGELPAMYYPAFVMFKDINDPNSVTLVREQAFFPMRDHNKQPEDNFEKLFGKGFKLKPITIEITNEPVTWKMNNILPWLKDFYSKRLDGDRYGSSSELANTLSAGSFSTGEKR